MSGKQPEVSELYDPHHPKHSLGKSEQTGVPPREGPSKIQMVQATIDNTKGEIQKTLHEMAKKGKKLEELEEQTMMLNETTTAFKAQTKKVRNQMWWKNTKMTIVLTITGIAILAAIIIPIVLKFQDKL